MRENCTRFDRSMVIIDKNATIAPPEPSLIPERATDMLHTTHTLELLLFTSALMQMRLI